MSAVLAAGLLLAFEKIALVDSYDYFRQYDIETVTGCVQVLENVLRTGADTILWRPHSGAKPRYPTDEEDRLHVNPSTDARCGAYYACGDWFAEYEREPDVIRSVYDFCRKSPAIRDWGAHVPMEDCHFNFSFLGNWNLEHPQYFCRDYKGNVKIIHHSFAYPEYREHRLRLIQEQIDRGANIIALDPYRYGNWRCDCEYVKPNLDRWKELYPNEPVPQDARDPRWVAICSESILKFVRGIRARCDAAGRKVRLFASVDFGSRYHDSETCKGFAWKRMVDEKLVDGICIAGIDLGKNRTYEEYERRLMAVRNYTRGKCACYFPIMAYNFDGGTRPSFGQLGQWNGLDEVASVKRLLEMADRCGADGITMEVVDFGNYRKVEKTIREFQVSGGMRGRPAEECPVEEMSVRTVGPGGGGYLYSMGLSLDPKRLYVGCDVGGFYRSDDLGRNYKILNTGLAGIMVNAIAEHPTNPDIILACTKAGANISRDGGYHWQSLRPVAKGVVKPSLYDSTWPIRAAAWSRTNPNRAWFGSGMWNKNYRTTKNVATVWRTDDCCQTLNMVVAKDSPLLSEKEIFSFSPHPTNPDEILCTTPGGIYLSTDGGVHWAKQTKGTPTDPRMWARWVCHARSNPRVVYASFVQWAGPYDPKHPHESGVWKSVDGGRSWAKCGGPKTNPSAGSSVCSFWNEAGVFVDPRDENVVWVSGLCFFRSAVWKTVDGGKTWAQSFTGKPQGWLDFWGIGTPRGMAISPSNPDVVAYGNSGSVYMTEDGGKTWNQRYTGSLDPKYCCGRGLEVTCLADVVADYAVKDRWYLPYMDLGLMITENGGRTLYRSTHGIPQQWKGTCFSLVQSPDDPKLLWSTWGRWGDCGNVKAGGLFAISRDAGESWSVTTNGGWTIAKWPRLAHLKGKAGNDILFAASEHQLLQVSRDGGLHWATNSFPWQSRVCSVTVNKTTGEVYVGTVHSESPRTGFNGALWRSSDEGHTWENLTAGVTNKIASVNAVVFKGDTIVFAANHVHKTERGGGVFVSKDRGKTWTKTGFFLAIRKLAWSGDRLVVACSTRTFADATVPCGGVYATDDLGVHWTHLIAPGFDRPSASFVVADPHHPGDLWIGTGGNSIFVLSPQK